MKEYNYTNANYVTPGDELVYISQIEQSEKIKFDSSAIVFGKISTDEGVVANYSLTCFEDIQGIEIVVQQDLICYKDIECEVLEVGGSLKCYGHISAREIYVTGETIINSAYIISGELQKDVMLEGTLEVEDVLTIGGGAICKEGAVGAGSIKCDYLYANDYLEIKVEGEIIDKTQIEDEQKNYFVIPSINAIEELAENNEVHKVLNIRKKILTGLQDEILRLSHEAEVTEIKAVLKKLVEMDNSFKDDYVLISFIKKIEEVKSIGIITDFLELVKYKKKSPEYLREFDTCAYLFNQYLEKQRSNIESMTCENIKSHREFVYALTLLESVKNELSEYEYEIILDKIYGHIGIKYKLISRSFK